MPVSVGIDLGTTFSAVAVCEPADAYPEMVLNSEGNPTTPSVIHFHNGQVIYGSEAADAFKAGIPGCATSFKRLMGKNEVCCTVDGESYTAETLSELLLSHLIKEAQQTLQATITDAVITVPAYFDSKEREAIFNAAKRAGIHARLIDEPSAAALAYGVQHWSENAHILVYDLGGGTFDVTLVRMVGDGALRAVATSGDHTLGGRDWDKRLVDLMNEKLESLTGHDFRQNWDIQLSIQGQAESIKKQLSSMLTVRSTLYLPGYGSETVTITRAEFDNLTKDLLGRTGALCRTVLKEAGVGTQDITDVLMVGGSTRMPQVREHIRSLMGKDPITFRPDEAIALGAAIQATKADQPYVQVQVVELDGKTATNRVALGLNVEKSATILPQQRRSVLGVTLYPATQHALGIIAENSDRSLYINEVIIPAHHPRPAAVAKGFTFYTREGEESLLEIYVLQGDHEKPLDCKVQYLYIVSGIKHVAATKGETFLRIQYSYDINGIIHVEARQEQEEYNLPIQRVSVPDDLSRFGLPIPAPASSISETLSLVMAIDVSGSMSGEPMKEAKDAMRQIVHSMDPATTSIGIIAFSDESKIVCPVTSDWSACYTAIDSIRVGQTGGSNAGHPFSDIQNMLQQEKGRRFALVLADGVWLRQSKAIAASKQCNELGIETAAVGFGGADVEFLKAISSCEANAIYTQLSMIAEAMFSVVPQSRGASGARSGQEGKTVEVAPWAAEEVM